MQFSYRAADISGKIESGREEADSKEQLITKLKAQGKYLLEASESRPTNISFAHFVKRSRLSPQERLTFTQQLASLLMAGIPLEKSLGILGKLRFSPEMSEVINQIRRFLQEGLSFTIAIEKYPNHFPPLYVNMVKAGEAGGILPQVLNRLAVYLEEEINLKRFVTSSLFYPVLLMVASIGAILFYVSNVIPQFKNIFAGMGSQLPIITRVVMVFGEGLINYWPVIILLIALLIGWYAKEKSTEEGQLRIDRMKLKLPLVGTVLQKIAVSRLTLALSLLFESGVSLLTSLNIASDIMGNKFMAKALKEVEFEVRQGNSLSGSMLSKQVFPTLAVEMIGVGEESGSLGNMLQQISRTYDGEVKHSMTLFLSIFEPVMLMVMVGVIAILAVAIILPVTNMSNQI